jgi:histidinol-phosphate aminotransferase
VGCREAAAVSEPKATPADLLRPEVLAQSTYQVQDADGFIKLDAMENPYPWPGELTEAWLESLRGVQANRYPDPEARALKAALRETLDIPAGAGLILGNGSDELIQLLTMAVAKPGSTVLAPEPTFVMYRLIAGLLGLDYRGVPLSTDFGLDSELMLQAIRESRPAVVWIAYPNNPTGNLFSRPVLEAVLEQTPGLVVMDEAYHPFAGESFLPLLPEHANLLVMRTLSKSGLAGLRLGLLAGQPSWIEQLEKLRLPYNINALSQLSAHFALLHMDSLNSQAAVIRAEREHLLSALGRLPGVRVFPSDANFLLYRVSPRDPVTVFEGLRERGVLVKLMHAPTLDGCLRVTVGMPAENARFLAAMHELCESGSRLVGS